jgi:hypothetical protein
MVPISHGPTAISEKRKSLAFLLDLYLYFPNISRISNIAGQVESVDEVIGITDDWTQSQNLENSMKSVTVQQLKYLDHPEDITNLQ